jgi:aspartate/tyrosine/aromatic aminotransferase
VKTIQSHLFWLQLAQVEEIVTPIAEAQVLAQADHAYLGYVRGRWDKIWQHLRQCAERSLSIFTASLWQKLEARKTR